MRKLLFPFKSVEPLDVCRGGGSEGDAGWVAITGDGAGSGNLNPIAFQRGGGGESVSAARNGVKGS